MQTQALKIPNRGLLSATPSSALKTSFGENQNNGGASATKIPQKYTELRDRGLQTELTITDIPKSDSSCQLISNIFKRASVERNR